MSPHRTGGERRGKFRFDRRFPGVGRINVSSGTANPQEFRRRDAVLTKLFDSAQVEVLQAFRQGLITIEQLVDADRAGRLRSAELLSDLALREGLSTAIERTLPSMGKSSETRRRYGTSLHKLRARARLGADTKVSDLARVPWKALAGSWGGSAADWNHMRRAVSTFLSTLLGDVYHPFRRSVVKQIPTADEGTGREPDITVERFLEILERVPAHARPCYWVLALTGMRTGEYLRCTKADIDSVAHTIAVPGTKTGASRAKVQVEGEMWGWIEAGIPSPLKYGWMRTYFKRAVTTIGQPDLRLHDLRHFMAQLASDAGAPTPLIQAALRHRDPGMTRRYEMRKGKGEVARLVGRALRAGAIGRTLATHRSTPTEHGLGDAEAS